jgi:hypothetical protein
MKRVQLRNQKRYEVLAVNRKLTETTWARIPTLVIWKQLWLRVLRSQYDAYRLLEGADYARAVWIHYSEFSVNSDACCESIW